MSATEKIVHELQEAAKVLDQFTKDENNLQKIDEAATIMVNAVKAGGKLFSCGNGGSFCDAVHFAEELTGKFREERDPIPAIAISDGGHLTCTANDFGYDRVFSRFLRAIAQKGDVLLAISTSGNSQNIINAAELAKQRQMKVIALTGKQGGKLAEFCDVMIQVPHIGYADRIQEVHIKIIHILIMLIEEKMSDAG